MWALLVSLQAKAAALEGSKVPETRVLQSAFRPHSSGCSGAQSPDMAGRPPQEPCAGGLVIYITCYRPSEASRTAS